MVCQKCEKKLEKLSCPDVKKKAVTKLKAEEEKKETAKEEEEKEE